MKHLFTLSNNWFLMHAEINSEVTMEQEGELNQVIHMYNTIIRNCFFAVHVYHHCGG